MKPSGSGRPGFHRREMMLTAIAAAVAPVACANPPGPRIEDPVAGRKLVFDESFETLNRQIWNCGPKAGTAEPGYYGRSAFARFGGEEGFNPYAIVSDDRTENRKALQISLKYIGKRMHVPHYYGNDQPETQWISGNVQTARSDGTIQKGWRNGYFEARMLFPRHPLTFPAFWLLNGRCILSPERSVEIDIAEHKGFQPSLYGVYLHEHGGSDAHSYSTGAETPVDVTTQYCRYGVLIDGATCIPFFERKPVINPQTGAPNIWTIGRAAELDADHDVFWPLLTLAMLADYAYPNPLLEEHKLAHLRIDYVRVYA